MRTQQSTGHSLIGLTSRCETVWGVIMDNNKLSLNLLQRPSHSQYMMVTSRVELLVAGLDLNSVLWWKLGPAIIHQSLVRLETIVDPSLRAEGFSCCSVYSGVSYYCQQLIGWALVSQQSDSNVFSKTEYWYDWCWPALDNSSVRCQHLSGHQHCSTLIMAGS